MNDILDKEDKVQPKKSKIKIAYIVIVFIFAWILISIGILFKLQSWPYASELLTMGVALNVLSLLLVLLRLRLKK